MTQILLRIQNCVVLFPSRRGIILYAMMCGRLPFNDNSLHSLIQQTKGKIQFPPKSSCSTGNKIFDGLLFWCIHLLILRGRRFEQISNRTLPSLSQLKSKNDKKIQMKNHVLSSNIKKSRLHNIFRKYPYGSGMER